MEALRTIAEGIGCSSIGGFACVAISAVNGMFDGYCAALVVCSSFMAGFAILALAATRDRRR